MSKKFFTDHSRRKFIHQVTKGTLAYSFAPGLLAAASGMQQQKTLGREKKYSANDQLQIGLIGAGGMGTADANTAITIPGVKLIAACDLYQGRLDSAKKTYGQDIFTTNDYHEIINRNDIDAVIVATPDHWHKQISVDAMNSGKSVYCEKPMVHDVTEGHAVVDAQTKNKIVFQVGSQGMSSLGNEKAKQLLKEGAIGELIELEKVGRGEGAQKD